MAAFERAPQSFGIVEIQDYAFFFRRNFQQFRCVCPHNFPRTNCGRCAQEFRVKACGENQRVAASAVVIGQHDGVFAGVECIDEVSD